MDHSKYSKKKKVPNTHRLNNKLDLPFTTSAFTTIAPAGLGCLLNYIEWESMAPAYQHKLLKTEPSCISTIFEG